MPFHHLALAVKDMKLTHEFYEKAMGFELAHVERAVTPEGGFANHYFYDTGEGELMAFWELQDPAIPEGFPTGLSESAGLPDWVNHLAFACRDKDHLEEITERWRGLGLTVIEMDHHWCHSIYQLDPDGNFVEFSYTTAPHGKEQRERALRAIAGETLPPDAPPDVKLHEPTGPLSLSFTPRSLRGTMAEVLAAVPQ